MAPTSSTGGESCGPSAMKAAGMGILASYRQEQGSLRQIGKSKECRMKYQRFGERKTGFPDDLRALDSWRNILQ